MKLAFVCKSIGALFAVLVLTVSIGCGGGQKEGNGVGQGDGGRPQGNNSATDSGNSKGNGTANNAPKTNGANGAIKSEGTSKENGESTEADEPAGLSSEISDEIPPGFAKVRGSVTLDGKPLADAIVTFAAQDNRFFATGITDANGKYSLVTLVKGKLHSSVSQGPNLVSIAKYEDLDIEQTLPPDDAGIEVLQPKLDTPAKYAATEASGLVVEVAASNNVFDFHLAGRE